MIHHIAVLIQGGMWVELWLVAVLSWAPRIDHLEGLDLVDIRKIHQIVVQDLAGM